MHDHHHSASHDHGHSHGPSGSHAHAHSHGHVDGLRAATPTVAVAAIPGFSLLRLSAGQRLAGAGVIVIALWGAVYWALQ